MLKRVVWDSQIRFTRYAEAIIDKLRRGDFKEVLLNALKSWFGWDLFSNTVPHTEQRGALALTDGEVDSGLLALVGIAGY